MSDLATSDSNGKSTDDIIQSGSSLASRETQLAIYSRNAKVLGFFLLGLFISKPIMTVPIIGDLSISNSIQVTVAAMIAIGFGLVFTFMRWNYFAEFSAWTYYGIVGTTVYTNWDFGTGLEKITFGMFSSAELSWWLLLPVAAFLLIECSKSTAKVCMHLNEPKW
jgi:hypothetical protein